MTRSFDLASLNFPIGAENVISQTLSAATYVRFVSEQERAEMIRVDGRGHKMDSNLD